MKEETEAGLRKSNRQRVPNSFYTEGINELKRAPRPPREPPKQPRKRSRVFEEEEENSLGDEIAEEDRSEQMRSNSGSYFPCRMPKSGVLVNVRFVLGPQEDPLPVKREDPPPPPAKPLKKESNFDLLSLFQKAIENVNENDRQVEPEPPREKAKVQVAVPKQRREDQEGRIVEARVEGRAVVVRHSKLGEGMG
jgi:hypothetical protein